MKRVKAEVEEQWIMSPILSPSKHGGPWEAAYTNRADTHPYAYVQYVHTQYTLLKTDKCIILTLGGLNG